jgi:hypothetical protein
MNIQPLFKRVFLNISPSIQKMYQMVFLARPVSLLVSDLSATKVKGGEKDFVFPKLFCFNCLLESIFFVSVDFNNPFTRIYQLASMVNSVEVCSSIIRL